jgi:hypothetical protein
VIFVCSPGKNGTAQNTSSNSSRNYSFFQFLGGSFFSTSWSATSPYTRRISLVNAVFCQNILEVAIGTRLYQSSF